MRMFENAVLRGIVRPKRDEVTGGWKKLIISSHLQVSKMVSPFRF
jgi:hypothetical protein